MLDSDCKSMLYYAIYNSSNYYNDFVNSLIYNGGSSLTFYKTENKENQKIKFIETNIQFIPSKFRFDCGTAFGHFMRARRELVEKAKNCKSYLFLNEQVKWRDIVMKKTFFKVKTSIPGTKLLYLE
ncbi:hypothetical protein ABK040_016893 [Willaertia magna]